MPAPTGEIVITDEVRLAQRQLSTVVGLGDLAIRLKNSLYQTRELLRANNVVEAPEGWCVLVEPLGDETPLRIERMIPGTESSRAYLNVVPIEDQIEVILGARKSSNDYLAFIGRTLEYDSEAESLYAYSEDKQTRVDASSYTRVTMPALESAERRFPTQLWSAAIAPRRGYHTPFGA